MSGDREIRDRREARMLAVVLVVLVAVLGVGLLLYAPALAEFNQAHLAPGVDLKESAVIAFFATILVLVIFAIAAGDGLLGELQFMLLGFFAFFLVLWLMIAWIF